MPVFKPHTATEDVTRGHVKDPEFKHIAFDDKAQVGRPSMRTLVLRSDDRLVLPDSTAANAMFNLGDLRAAWNIKNTNLDVGKVHWNLSATSFALSKDGDTPKLLEIQTTGFPTASDTWDSGTQGASAILALVPGDDCKAQLMHPSPLSLRELPSGIVTICLNDHGASDLATDSTLKWVLVMTLEPYVVNMITG